MSGSFLFKLEAHMTSFAATGMLIGAIVGFRFTMLALVPATICSLVIAWASGAMRDGVFGSTMELAVLVICLQIGYLAGATLRFFFYNGIKRRAQRLASDRPLSRIHSR